ncbi:MAG: hypothetical protein ACRDIL_03335, partial [Candidatus Limnocylindrales bacterium]
GTVVGLALNGPDVTAERAAVVPPVVPSGAPSARADAPRSVRLDEPARRDEVVTSREIVVRGRVARSVGQIWIMLESRGGKPIATNAIDPTGMPRGEMIPFESRFQVAMPRPAGSMMVVVVAIGPDGVPVDAIRRRFELGAIIDIPARVRTDAPPVRSGSKGEDGVMGGIPFGTNFLPRP